MFEEIAADLAERFEKAAASLKRDFARIRTGRASASLLDGVAVDYYGVQTPVTQVATVKIPEPRLITVSPWEKSLLGAIEKAIMKADLGVTPNNDGTIIRLPIPPLTGERRQELAKAAKKIAEDARIAVRNARRDANDMLKDLQKDGELTEDDLRRDLTKVQELTDKAIAHVDALLAEKEQEILEV
ncbi:MAG: ribosome recycling factor [Myxococcales bacterium]|nr:ribosome recycling factor [Myxococcales bacterium]MCB9521166.1 ribosome recycling factor [Myxococcales bacterium]MCB9530524.1 ribosome recycling factor [Myxococcales bacterium]